MRLIILAAGQGSRLRPLTDDRPKCLVMVGGKSILERLLETAHDVGITDIVIVGGYRADTLRQYGLPIVINDRFTETNMVHSLFCAAKHFGEGFVLSYGDIFYRPDILRRVAEEKALISVAVDEHWQPYWARRFDNVLDDAETLRIEDGRIVEIGGKPSSINEIEAQYLGLLAFRGEGVAQLRSAYTTAREEAAAECLKFGRAKSLDGMYVTDLLQGMADRGVVLNPVRVHGGWAEIDTKSDLELAEHLMAEGRFEVRQ
jgi:choline kinase